MSLSISSKSYTYNNMYTNKAQYEKSANRLSSGKRINSVADDAAGLAISKKLEALINGLEKGTENSYDMQNLLKTADGGLDTVSDSLQRIRELALQSQNGIYTADDKALLQHEVDSLLHHIDASANNTQFNNKNLLDGSFTNQHTAADAHGGGMNVTIGGVSTKALGISGFDITKDFDLSAIDNAISAVNSVRSTIGASVNRLDYTINYNQQATVNQAQALSRIQDADMAKESMNLNKSRVLEQYQIFSLKRQMSGMGSIVNFLL